MISALFWTAFALGVICGITIAAIVAVSTRTTDA